MNSTPNLKINIVANFAGKLLQALSLLVLVPIYVRILGVEAYGLIGFFASLTAVLGLLDAGLSLTATRESSRAASTGDMNVDGWKLVRSIELLYWGLAAIIGITLALLSGPIATKWVKSSTLSHNEIQLAVIILALTLAVRWPIAIYSGVLQGVQRQVAVNVILAVNILVKGGGSVLVLLFVAPSITAFLAWQGIAGVVEIAMYLWACRNCEFFKVKSAFGERLRLFRQVWRYSASVSLLNFLVLIIFQSDKLFISKLLPLEQLGYYTLSSNLASAVMFLMTPITVATFPRFSGILVSGDDERLVKLFHEISQFISIIVVGAASLLLFFPQEMLVIWTHNTDLAQKCQLSLSVLAFGIMMNGLVQIENQLQLASGATRYLTWIYAVAAGVTVVLMIICIPRWGIVGAAIVTAGVNTLFYLVIPQFLHSFLLKNEKWTWYLNDTGRYLVVGGGVFGLFRGIHALVGSVGHQLVLPAAAGICYLLAVVLMTDSLKQYVGSLLLKQKSPA